MTQEEGGPLPFGTLLKAFRKRRHLTQQQLAMTLGLHRHAIGRWEQGDFLPASKTIVLELARQLHLDSGETRQLLEASLTALVPYWSVPFPRNQYFTGRNEVLEKLYQQLSVNQAMALTQSTALHGLGGVGKTQIALEYAYQHSLEYNAVFWIRAETEEQILSSLMRIAEVLQVPEQESRDQQRVMAAVHRWLTAHDHWLLIWDNMEDLALLDRFLPPARPGAILITTRHQALGTIAFGLSLLPMEQEEGIVLLFHRTKILELDAPGDQVRILAEQMPAQYAAAAELVTLLGGLPLALDQAGAYVEETHCGLPAYLELFRNRRDVLLKQRGEGASDHLESVFTTFSLAIATTAERHPTVEALLRLCALLQPEAIPEEIFLQGGALLGGTLEAVCGDTLEWNQLIRAVCSYSLLSRQAETHTLSMHRLVQAVLLDHMTTTEREQGIRSLVGVFDAIFPTILPDTELVLWKQGKRLLPHALLCLHRTEALEQSLTLASVAYKVALYLRECGRYAEAEPLLQRALCIYVQIQGPDHLDVARTLTYLAVLYWNQARYAEAEPLNQRALQIRESTLGPNHPEVSASLNNLGLLYWYQGRYQEAEPLMQRALQLRELSQGPDHPRVALALNNLAGLYHDQGKYLEAEALHLRAFAIWGRALGPVHPQMTLTLISLADLYRDQGKYPEAEVLLQRALQIQETALGLTHPDVSQTLSGLADLSYDQQQYAEAETYFQQALQIQESILGADHPDVAHLLNGLANIYRDTGNDTEAESFYQRALSIREERLGPHHPATAHTLHELALFHQQQGRLREARSLTEQALSIRIRSLGEAHPKTIATQALYDQLLQGQGCREGEPCADQPVEQMPPSPSTEKPTDGLVCRGAPSQASGDPSEPTPSLSANTHLLCSSPSDEGGGASGHQTGSRTISPLPDRRPLHTMRVAVRGATEHIAYTRTVRMRAVTFTCTICGQTVTEWHYPSGRIKYCSEACRAISVAQRHEERVVKQREKRRIARRAQLPTQQGKDL